MEQRYYGILPVSIPKIFMFDAKNPKNQSASVIPRDD